MSVDVMEWIKFWEEKISGEKYAYITVLDTSLIIKESDHFTEDDIQHYLENLEKIINNVKTISNELNNERKKMLSLENDIRENKKEQTLIENILKNFKERIIAFITLERNQLLEEWNEVSNILFNFQKITNIIVYLQWLEENIKIKEKLDELLDVLLLIPKYSHEKLKSYMEINILFWRPYKLTGEVKWQVVNLIEGNL